jgi:hypothetical protein
MGRRNSIAFLETRGGTSTTWKTLVLAGVMLLIIFVAAATVVINSGTGGSIKGPVSPEQFLSDTYLGYLLSNPQKESPVGIASYGISNESGSLQAYSINSSEAVGEANISSIAALTHWNYSINPIYSALACVDCATLQMNVNAMVQTGNGEQVFWIQNALPFANANTHKVLMPIGIVFNYTKMDAGITHDASGTGAFSTLVGNIVYGLGSFLGQQVSYSLPLTVKMTTSISLTPTGVNISLSDEPFGNGTLAEGDYAFGWVNLPIRNATSASIIVTTSLYPWSQNNGYYPTFDSELVWTAYCCGQTTEFTEMNSNLSLSYLNFKGQVVPYPSFYSFGEVIETANNLRVTPTQTGGHVVIGENNNSYLGT